MAQQKKYQDIPELDYIKLFFHCLRKWYWFVLCVLVCVGIAFLYLQCKTTTYQVYSTIMIRSDNNLSTSSIQADMMQLMGYQTSKVISDEIQIISSASMMEKAVKELDLCTEYRKKDGLRWRGQYPLPDVSVAYPQGVVDTLKGGALITLEREATEYVVTVEYRKAKQTIHVYDLQSPLNTIIGQISFTENHALKVGEQVSITTLNARSRAMVLLPALSCQESEHGSNIILISMKSDIPGRAVAIINKLTELYNLDAVIDKNIMATNTANFINERLIIVEDELNDVEGNVESYMKANGLTDLSKELQLVLSNQTSYQKELVEIETQINLLHFLRDYLLENGMEESLIPSNLGLKDASLQQLIKEYNNLALQSMRIARSATESNPAYIQSQEQMHMLKEAILTSIDNLCRGLEISKSDIARKEREYHSKIYQVPERERRYVEIKRQQEIKEKLYIYLYQKREENALTLASTVMPAKVIDRPIVSGIVSPRSGRIYLLTVLFGLVLPFLVIFLMDYLNDEVKDQQEFQSVVKAPFLGHVLYCNSEDVVAVGSHNNSAQAELFRTIRTNLRFMLTEKRSPVILVTSALNGEGKSYVAINIAASLALLKKKVILIGLDIRKPTLSQYLHIDFKGHLTSYLLDPTIPLDDLIIPSGAVDNLDVMPSGAIPPNPGELIQSPRMDLLFSSLKERYDYVIVDTSPLYLVSDTFHLDKFADMTIFVTRANYISREMLPYIQDIYAQQKMHNMACILNASTGGKRGYGYGRYGYGRYGYGRYGYAGYGYYGEKHKDAY